MTETERMGLRPFPLSSFHSIKSDPSSDRSVERASKGPKMESGAKMPIAENSLLARITVDPAVRFGKPCIRGHRITVQEILEWLSSGASQAQILSDYPQLESEDFLAVYAYAAALAAERKISAR